MFRGIVLPSERQYLFASRRGVITQTTWIFNTIDVRTPNPAADYTYPKSSRTVVGPSQPPIQRAPGARSLKLKRPKRESDQSISSSAKVNNSWSHISTPAICLHSIHRETIFTGKSCRHLPVKIVVKQPRHMDTCIRFLLTLFSPQHLPTHLVTG
jgi:hypothetical protein